MKFVIEGINGAGKTPTINCIKDIFYEFDKKAECYAPFHLVRDRINGKDIYPLWNSNPLLAVDLLSETIEDIESRAEDNGVDVLIFDRHWMTAFTQLYKAPEISEVWRLDKPPTVLMTAPIHHTNRIASRGYSAEWLQKDQLKTYTDTYDNLYESYKELMLGKFIVSSQNQALMPIAKTIFELVVTEIGDKV